MSVTGLFHTEPVPTQAAPTTLCTGPGQWEIRNGSKGPSHKGPAACIALALHRRKYWIHVMHLFPVQLLDLENLGKWTSSINTFCTPLIDLCSALISLYFVKTIPACSHFICCSFSTSFVCFAQVKPPQTPSALNWQLWHSVKWRYKTAMTRWATLVVCIKYTQLSLSIKWWLIKPRMCASRRVQTHHRGS